MMPRRFLRFSSRRFFLWCSLTFLISLYFCLSVVRLDLEPCDFLGILVDYVELASSVGRKGFRRTTTKTQRKAGPMA